MNEKDQLLIDELKRDEGFVDHAYQDSKGFWTIGVGRLVDKRKGGSLSAEEIDYLLSNDIDKKVADLDEHLPWWRTLSYPRQRVLVNMCFNLGITGLLGFKNTLTYMQKGEFKKAADGMRNSLWASQVHDRAKRLADMMEKG